MSNLEFILHVTLTRDDGPPQEADAIGEALQEEIDTLTIEADSRDDGEVSVYSVSVERREYGPKVGARG